MKDIPVVLLIIRLFIQGTQSKDSVLDKVQISQINQVICLHIILININRHSISQRMFQAERNRKVNRNRSSNKAYSKQRKQI